MAKTISINFDEGYKEYLINDDENRVIRVDTADYGILTRAHKANDAIQARVKDFDIDIGADGRALTDDDTAIAEVEALEAFIRAQVDYIFDAPVSGVAFGNKNALSTRKGVMLYERFINAIMPIIEKDLEAENKASQARVDRYTKQAQQFAAKVGKKGKK